jgi:hypothetical protein
MLCDNCQTELPDEAAACWKCGKLFKSVAAPTPLKKQEPDSLLLVGTFVFSGIFFICGGWAFPFTVWGKMVEYTSHYPEWSSVTGVLSGALFIVTAIAVFGVLWWGSYWLIKRIVTSPAGR